MTVTFKVTNTTNISGHEDWEIEVVTNRGHQQINVVTLKPGESTECYAYQDQEIWVRHAERNERRAIETPPRPNVEHSADGEAENAR